MNTNSANYAHLYLFQMNIYDWNNNLYINANYDSW